MLFNITDLVLRLILRESRLPIAGPFSRRLECQGALAASPPFQTDPAWWVPLPSFVSSLAFMGQQKRSLGQIEVDCQSLGQRRFLVVQIDRMHSGDVVGCRPCLAVLARAWMA